MEEGKLEKKIPQDESSKLAVLLPDASAVKQSGNVAETRSMSIQDFPAGLTEAVNGDATAAPDVQMFGLCHKLDIRILVTAPLANGLVALARKAERPYGHRLLGFARARWLLPIFAPWNDFSCAEL